VDQADIKFEYDSHCCIEGNVSKKMLVVIQTHREKNSWLTEKENNTKVNFMKHDLKFRVFLKGLFIKYGFRNISILTHIQQHIRHIITAK
jgi:hypothetical protein